MTHRIARCEAALLATVEAMEQAMDAALVNSAPITEAEELVLYQYYEKMRSSSSSVSSSAPVPPIPSFISKLIAEGRRGADIRKRLRGGGNGGDADEDHDAAPLIGVGASSSSTASDALIPAALRGLRTEREGSSSASNNGTASSANSNPIANLLAEADVAKVVGGGSASSTEFESEVSKHHEMPSSASYATATHSLGGGDDGAAAAPSPSSSSFSSHAHAMAATITDVDRQRLVSNVEAKKRNLQKIAKAVTDSFELLTATIDGLPDVPLERIENDLRELTNENLALRDEVVGLYDHSVALYEKLLRVDHTTSQRQQ